MPCERSTPSPSAVRSLDATTWTALRPCRGRSDSQSASTAPSTGTIAPPLISSRASSASVRPRDTRRPATWIGPRIRNRGGSNTPGRRDPRRTCSRVKPIRKRAPPQLRLPSGGTEPPRNERSKMANAAYVVLESDSFDLAYEGDDIDTDHTISFDAD